MAFDLTAMECPDFRELYEIWMSGYVRAGVEVAAHLGIVDAFVDASTTADVAARLSLSKPALDALVHLLCSAKVFQKGADERFQATSVARAYLSKTSPVSPSRSDAPPQDPNEFSRIVAALEPGSKPRAHSEGTDPLNEKWSKGTLSDKEADDFIRMMLALTLFQALAEVRSGAFEGLESIVDVGGGSGAFAMALAAHEPSVRSVLMDLPQVCASAERLMQGLGVTAPVEKYPCNFLSDPWPKNSSAFHFSNILHDWSTEICLQLLRNAWEALPKQGRVFIHEAFLDADKTSPLGTCIMNLTMWIDLHAQQFTESEVSEMLRSAGFVDIRVRKISSMYSLMEAVK
ncbi:MAG: hypothetical protein KDD69_17760 [Bdellovibrionales bacterium]|nr:hypothetical protein [Bdellovibrionales bacterium]